MLIARGIFHMWLTLAGVAAAVWLLAGCRLDRRKPGLPAFYSRQQNWFWMRGGGATAFQSERPNITFRVMYDLPGTNGLSKKNKLLARNSNTTGFKSKSYKQRPNMIFFVAGEHHFWRSLQEYQRRGHHYNILGEIDFQRSILPVNRERETPAPSAALLFQANQKETDTSKIPAKSCYQTWAGSKGRREQLQTHLVQRHR